MDQASMRPLGDYPWLELVLGASVVCDDTVGFNRGLHPAHIFPQKFSVQAGVTLGKNAACCVCVLVKLFSWHGVCG